MRQAFLVVISTLANILSLLVVVDSLLSWVLSPLHPIRETLGRILQPIYAPVRRIVPPLGGMDFTPIVVLLLIYVIQQIAITLLR